MKVLLSLFNVIAFATVVTIIPVTEDFAAYAQDASEEKSSRVLAKPVESSHVNSALALTTQHPDIPIEELELLVRPLTLAQLENEAAAWLLILQAKVQEISNTAIAVNEKTGRVHFSKKQAKLLKKSGLLLSKRKLRQPHAQKNTKQPLGN